MHSNSHDPIHRSSLPLNGYVQDAELLTIERQPTPMAVARKLVF
jgi:hypothetical protein